MGQYKIGVVIPAFNEEKSIGSVVSEILSIVDCVFVINDCSTDNTRDIALQVGAIVIDNPRNRGYSKTIESGLKYVSELVEYDYVLTVDADGQHSLGAVNDVIRHLRECDPDIVVGVRSEFARFSELIFSYYYRFKYGVKDPLCGLKAYKTDLVRCVGGSENFDTIGTGIMQRVLAKTNNVVQVKIDVLPRSDQPRFGGTVRANLQILTSLLKTIVLSK